MSNPLQLRSVATRWLASLQAAGLSDLPAGTDRQLGQMTLESGNQKAAASETADSDVREMPAGYDTPQSESPPTPAAPGAGADNAPVAPLVNSSPAGWGATLDSQARVQRLTTLAAAVADCTRCPELANCRTQTVFGVGNPDPRLCFFGEAPGADEDRLGEPFVGRAGELLNRIIGACQMKREDVYILNTVKCRPPANRNPQDQEIANCREYFEQQLEILQPEFICCLGSVAARTLLDTRESIGRLRGRFHSYRGSQVVVTYHPAYLLRTPAAKSKTWDDMKMLMGAMGIELPGG